MGKTVLIYQIKPNELEKIDETIEALKKAKKGEFRDAKKIPIGFGVEIIKVAFTVAEKDDKAVEELTRELNSLELVEEAEMKEMTLL